MAESEDLFGSQEDQFINNLISNNGNEEITPENDVIESMDTEPIKKTVKNVKLTEFPITRVKGIMKMDPDVHMASQESVYLVAKATELFLNSIVKETCKHTMKAKRKTVQKVDIDAAIENLDCLCFLEGALE